MRRFSEPLWKLVRWPPVLAAAAVVAAGWASPATATDSASPPTAAEAQEFMEAVEAHLLELAVESERAGWVQSTYITGDTELLAARAYERLIAATVEAAQQATRFDGLKLPAELARKLAMLKLSLTLPAPSDAAERAELTRIAAGMESAYGRGRYCRAEDDCRDLGQLSRLMAESRDPAALLDAWVGWRTVSPPLRAEYRRFAELANKGARELGFADLGALWRSKYDMPPEEFLAEVDRLWGQVRPLYDALHCYVRRRLSEFYGPEVAPAEGPIPAHLLGNMWAQSWANLYPQLAPADADPGFDLTNRLRTEGVTPQEMVRYGERFFTSLGFEPLPATFWERSLFEQPVGRDVVCHASAWNIDHVDDVRIKMCIEINAEDFQTVHHELGHNFYQRAYNVQPPLFRESANDGFHEAVGDTVALSVTPGYLVQVGLLESEPDPAKDLGLLLRTALDRVAFLPFGLVVDRWRWGVFSGEIPEDAYNAGWWELRRAYQGIAPPVARTEEQFDPGAKYHVPANTPYTRYFLAHVLQFQFHRALCEAAGYQGPLHRCSIYGSAAAGEKLIRMLEMGSSRPWPDALAALGGQRQMDATAILDYFAPLAEWLAEQNRGQTCGW